MSSNEESKEERPRSSHSISPNIQIVTSPILEEVRVVVEKLVVPPGRSPRHKDLRSETEKAEDLE
jgi:hypothetical protein